ncbi:MAG: beta-lactamase family protein, partial [Alphaproteobacteria bacterium]|nr:beta-lactamase family protein [Alphaproteobacteria bacterium]
MARTSGIDRVLQEAVDRGVVGGVVGVAADATAPVYEGAFGERMLGSGVAMTPDTIFLIASMTKAITAAAAMQLVEQGKLTLDEPLGRFAPELGEPQVLAGFDTSGAPLLRPAKRTITLRQLMTHTAGFGYDTWNPLLNRYVAVTGLPAVRSGKLAALNAPLVFDPGERWEYGINIDWVGRVVEAISGQDLDAYTREHLLAPLGMRNTGYVMSDAQAQRGAGTHIRGQEGGLTPEPFQKPVRGEFLAGGGGMFSTA